MHIWVAPAPPAAHKNIDLRQSPLSMQGGRSSSWFMHTYMHTNIILTGSCKNNLRIYFQIVQIPLSLYDRLHCACSDFQVSFKNVKCS